MMEGIYFGLHSIKLELQISPIDMYSVLAEQCDNVFLLESSEGSEKLSRYSFLSFSPTKHITLRNGIVEINGEKRNCKNPLEELKKEVGTSNIKIPGFIGGAVGYFSFDYIRYLEKLENNTKDDVNFPDFEFGIFDDSIVYDHRENSMRYVYREKNRIDELMKFIKNASFESKKFEMYNKKCNLSKEKFCENVETAKKHIVAGDIFQVVLSKRYEIRYAGSLIPFYRKLKAINPSPYMYYLKFGEREIIGSSPENLIRVEDREITSYATLAGTRPRGETPEQDAKLEKELLNDEKERAEHIMLVDLTRNDVGKISEPGSVKVSELMSVHKYSSVQHMASLVSGKLKEGKDAFDAFNSIFPAGTVSGAPKVRALEIIDELETTKRGPYAGAIGYFSANGNADFAIGIRTLFAIKGKAYIQTGAGIVYDSIPEKEFEETENKARALLTAIGDEKYEAVINR
ncbi:MAG: anthranilate synthase component I [Candidatus Micrarchaeota archaeon]|nr:anthranilate synthase component I [Candidatus Micrarchaeota archaeon]